MKKEKFLELASQLFDQTNLVVESKITLDKNTWDEIVDQIGSEINDLGRDLIDGYKLEMYSNEVTLVDVTLNYREIQGTIKNVLERYFEVK
jgi:diketogulonate reductase-like aldo/keto reductase